MKRLTYKTGFNIFICLCMLIIILFFSFRVVSAEQSGMITWDRTYGGSKDDWVSSLIQTTDGGYAVAGYTKSFGAGEADFWLLKLDKKGNRIWDKTYGGSGYDYASSLVQTSDGGYAVAGSTESRGAGGRDFWLLKLNSQGKLLWNRTYGGSKDDEARSLIQVNDGGYLLAGWTDSYGAGTYDFWLLKLNSQGKLLWDRTFGERGWDEARTIIQTSDGGYTVAGFTWAKGVEDDDDLWLLKLNSQGKLLWDRTFGGSKEDRASSLIQTSDGGYVVAGSTESKGAGGLDFWLLKLNSQGKLLWDRTFGGSKDDVVNSFIQTSDGGYAVAGSTTSKGAGNYDFWLLKLDKQGNQIWDRTFGAGTLDWANSLVQTSDGGYVVAGSTESKGAGGRDFWLLKLNNQGKLKKIEIKKEPEIKIPTKVETADLTLLVITPLSSVFSLKKHDLIVTINGPTYDSKTFKDVGTAKPVPVYFYNIPEGHYKVTAKYGSKKISKEINVSGDTLDLQMTFY